MKMLCFALDRIDKATPLPSYRYLPYEGDINLRFKDIVGVTYLDEEPLQHIVFWVSDSTKEYVGNKPLHGSQQPLDEAEVRRLRNDYPHYQLGDFYTIDCKRNYELIRELCSFGENLVVISPQSIRAEIYERICSMQARYVDMQTKL